MQMVGSQRRKSKRYVSVRRKIETKRKFCLQYMHSETKNLLIYKYISYFFSPDPHFNCISKQTYQDP